MLRLVALLLLIAPVALADQTATSNYNAARPKFWNQIYADGGFTLYCAQPFSRRIGLEIEHVYPASWMVQHLGCGSRTACRSSSTRFNHMEADLHNLFPARSGTNRARSNHPFGVVPGERREFGLLCDFEMSANADLAEPPPGARGDIARAIFYMHHEYQLPINPALLPTLKTWNHDDPPSAEERHRNDAIDVLQGTRNPFIDNPQLADPL